jgi:DNA-binding response OmpR family regulator
MIRAQSMIINWQTAGQRDGSKSGDSKRHAESPTAMVVDDDPAMLRLTAAMLVGIGYEVRTAGEGTDALFDSRNSPCDLVLTDYEMPIINGYQLGRRIKSQRPATRVVIMTGLGRAAVAGLMADNSIDGWLFKPFHLEELKAMLSGIGLSLEIGGEA